MLVCAFWPLPSSAADTRFPTRYDDQIRSAVRHYWAGVPDWTWWKAQLYQESQLDPNAESQVGAAGLAQFMPGTWADISRQMGFEGVSPKVARYAIEAGAYYMAQLRRSWVADRPPMEKHRLAQASYNAGTGHILEAQQICRDARMWDQIKPCLAQITGPGNARQTIDYVDHIARWQEMMR
ncbi:MAG TPA: transglycosylase SLT domain-containing protein [Terriglobia bacterium]|nr:transglycosylase SLT domain-containing protein [Terriglobia bacterium]